MCSSDLIAGVPAVAGDGDEDVGAEGPVDAIGLYRRQAIAGLLKDEAFLKKARSSNGTTWKAVGEALKEKLPVQIQDRDEVAFDMVRSALNEIFGLDRWEAYKQPRKDGSGKQVLWVKAKASA